MRIMVLGGGSCQLHLIKQVKQKGHEVILIDYLANPVGAKFSDVHLQISTFDIAKVLEASKEYEIDGIITLGTDQPVLTCAVVSEKLNLPFYINSEIALKVTNKRFMKQTFIDNDIPTVSFALLKKEFKDSQLDHITFPAIIKPVDSQGQRGIFKVASINDIREKINETLSFSRDEFVLVETFYPNDEITINGWVKNGKVTILSVVDRVTIKNNSSVGVCLCHNYPSVHIKQYKKQIDMITKRIVKSFAITDGPIYFQYLVGNEGVMVNEIAMRIGGAYEDLTIPIITDIDLLDLVLSYTFNNDSIYSEKTKTFDYLKNKRFLSTQMFFCKAGIIKKLTPIGEIKKLKGVVDGYYMIHKGQQLGDINNATARAGYILIKGDSFDDMINNINNVFDKLQVLDENGTNLINKYSDYVDKYQFIKE